MSRRRSFVLQLGGSRGNTAGVSSVDTAARSKTNNKPLVLTLKGGDGVATAAAVTAAAARTHTDAVITIAPAREATATAAASAAAADTDTGADTIADGYDYDLLALDAGVDDDNAVVDLLMSPATANRTFSLGSRAEAAVAATRAQSSAAAAPANPVTITDEQHVLTLDSVCDGATVNVIADGAKGVDAVYVPTLRSIRRDSWTADPANTAFSILSKPSTPDVILHVEGHESSDDEDEAAAAGNDESVQHNITVTSMNVSTALSPFSDDTVLRMEAAGDSPLLSRRVVDLDAHDASSNAFGIEASDDPNVTGGFDEFGERTEKKKRKGNRRGSLADLRAEQTSNWKFSVDDHKQPVSVDQQRAGNEFNLPQLSVGSRAVTPLFGSVVRTAEKPTLRRGSSGMDSVRTRQQKQSFGVMRSQTEFDAALKKTSGGREAVRWRWFWGSMPAELVLAIVHFYAWSALPFPKYKDSDEKPGGLLILGWLFHWIGLGVYALTLMGLLVRSNPYSARIMMGYQFGFTLIAMATSAHTQLRQSKQVLEPFRDNPNTVIQLEWFAVLCMYIVFAVLVYHSPKQLLDSALKDVQHVEIDDMKKHIRIIEAEQQRIVSESRKVSAQLVTRVRNHKLDIGAAMGTQQADRDEHMVLLKKQTEEILERGVALERKNRGYGTDSGGTREGSTRRRNSVSNRRSRRPSISGRRASRSGASKRDVSRSGRRSSRSTRAKPSSSSHKKSGRRPSMHADQMDLQSEMLAKLRSYNTPSSSADKVKLPPLKHVKMPSM
jgi:hypothetical protein